MELGDTKVQIRAAVAEGKMHGSKNARKDELGRKESTGLFGTETGNKGRGDFFKVTTAWSLF